MKIKIKRWDTGAIIVAGEYANIRECVEKNKNKSFYRANMSGANMSGANMSGADMSGANMSGANMRGADMRGVDMSGANMSGADLRWANLSGANMSEADLSGANLSEANLSKADLSWAKTDKRYISITCIGSRKAMTTYCFEDDKIWCGCWSGTLKEFEERVKDTHKSDPQYLAEYMGFIKYLKVLKK